MYINNMVSLCHAFICREKSLTIKAENIARKPQICVPPFVQRHLRCTRTPVDEGASHETYSASTLLSSLHAVRYIA